MLANNSPDEGDTSSSNQEREKNIRKLAKLHPSLGHPRGRRASRRIPRRALRHLPIAPTLIIKVRIPNDLLLRRDERINGAHPVLLRRTSFDPGQGGDAVINDDADLLAWD